MYSHPGETRTDVEETLNLIDRIAPFIQSAALQPAMIFPGTDLERIAQHRNLFPPNFSWCSPYESDLNRRLGQLANVPLYRECLSEEEMLEIQESFRIRNMANRGAAMSAGRLFSRTLKALRREPHLFKDAMSPSTLRRWLNARKRRKKE